MLAIRRRNRAQPTPPGQRFHTSRPLYVGLGKLVDTSVVGRLRSSAYHCRRRLATQVTAPERDDAGRSSGS